MSKNIGPEPFSCFDRRAKDILINGYNFDHKFTLLIPHSTGTSLTITGLKRDHFFVGDIRTFYKNGNTTVDVNLDTHSTVSTKVSVDNIFSHTKTIVSFKIPDHKSGKMDVEYCDEHAVINSSIGLNPSPLLELQAGIGTKKLSIGGEIGFDTASSSFIKYNGGISFNNPDLSLTLMMAEKGEVLKASYFQSVAPSDGTCIAAEISHRFSSCENSFTLATSHRVDSHNVLKTRFSDSGKIAMQWQREWRPKSFLTFSAEYDTKSIKSESKLGLALALQP